MPTFRSHVRREMERQQRLRQLVEQQEGKGQIASPEEMAEETLGWDRHRHKQKQPLGNMRPSPGSPKKPSP